MALADKLNDQPRGRTGLACSVGVLLEQLPTAEAAALDKMMHELGWSGRKIYDALTAEGYYVGQQTINRHRSSACSCFKSVA